MTLALASAPVQPTPPATAAATTAAYRAGHRDGARGLCQPAPFGGDPRYLHYYARGQQHGLQVLARRCGLRDGRAADPVERPIYLPECFDDEYRAAHAEGLAELGTHYDRLADAADPGRAEMAPYLSHRDRVMIG